MTRNSDWSDDKWEATKLFTHIRTLQRCYRSNTSAARQKQIAPIPTGSPHQKATAIVSQHCLSPSI